jgi:ribosomal protein L25 (general stress protein Ctc)
VLVAPREIQKDPVKNTIDHIDLVVLSADELAARLA